MSDTSNASNVSEIKISFPYNINEIINKKLDIDFFKNNPCIKEVYTTPFFTSSKAPDMNGRISTYNVAQALEYLYKLKALNINICIILNNPYYDYSNVMKELLSFNDLIDWMDVCDVALLKYNSIFKFKNSVINLPRIANYSNYKNFDMVYFHDDIIHRHDEFLEVNDILKGCVVNFTECLSYCHLKAKHYKSFNQGNYNFDEQYCPCHKMSNLQVLLKRCAILMDYSEYVYYSDVIDMYKLQGRVDEDNFSNAVKIVTGITRHKIDFKYPLKQYDYFQWKVKVRNCRGNCPKCNFCDNLCKKYLNYETTSVNLY